MKPQTVGVKTAVSMCFSMCNRPGNDAFDVRIKCEEIDAVNEFKHLGIILEKNLSNLDCICFSRRDLLYQNAKLYMHAMILLHLP